MKLIQTGGIRVACFSCPKFSPYSNSDLVGSLIHTVTPFSNLLTPNELTAPRDLTMSRPFVYLLPGMLFFEEGGLLRP